MSELLRPQYPQTLVDNHTQPPRLKHRLLKAVWTGLSTLVLSWLIVFIVPQVVDAARAYNFHAPDGIVLINSRLDLTDRGKNIFYASAPEINNSTDFNRNCGTQERTTAILGCYFKDKIYLYNLQNTELDGTLEVTAAHEMLHAAYQRLTLVERWRIDKAIVAQYEKVKDLTTIKELMAYYTKAEPGAEVDELHSILGTVIANLDPELESYYSRYFDDRAAVVALNTKYNHVFEQLRSESAAIEARLAAAEPEITALLAQYDADRAQLEADISDFNDRAKANTFASMASFNRERTSILSRVEAINAQRDTINAKVATYNADVESLNKISVHTSELYKSMNGAAATEAL